MRYIYGYQSKTSKVNLKSPKWLLLLLIILFAAFAIWAFTLTVIAPSYTSTFNEQAVNSDLALTYEQTLIASFYELKAVTSYAQHQLQQAGQSTINLTQQAIPAVSLMSIFFGLIIILTLVGQFAKKNSFKTNWPIWAILLIVIIVYVSIMVVGFVFVPDTEAFDKLRVEPSVTSDSVVKFYAISIFLNPKSNSNLIQDIDYSIIAYAVIVLAAIVTFFVLCAYNMGNVFRSQQRIW